MKKKLLYFLLLIVSWSDILGQVSFTSVTIEDVDMPAAKGMVRSWKPNFAVAYQTDGTNHYFSIIENYNTVMKSVKFSGNITVEDMQILGDTLYFCGSHNGEGFIDWIKVSDIYDASVSNSQGVKFRLDTTLPYTVSRMAVYYDGEGEPHIAAAGYWRDRIVANFYGSDTSYYIISRNFLVEIQDLSGSFVVQWATTNNDGSLIEGTINDVVATDNYVAFVGLNNDYSKLSIRRADKYSVFMSGYRIYDYNCLTMCKPVATAMNDDNIAVATSYEINPSVSNRIEIRSFKLGTMNMYDAQGFLAPDKSTAEDIIYVPRQNKLLLVPMLWQTTGAHYPVIYIDPGRSTPYNAPTVTPTSILSSHINLYDNDYFLLGGGGKVFAHFISSLDPNDNCISIGDYKMEAIEEVNYVEKRKNVSGTGSVTHSIIMNPTDHHYIPLCIFQ